MTERQKAATPSRIVPSLRSSETVNAPFQRGVRLAIATCSRIALNALKSC